MSDVNRVRRELRRSGSQEVGLAGRRPPGRDTTGGPRVAGHRAVDRDHVEDALNADAHAWLCQGDGAAVTELRGPHVVSE